jgi:GST-like protein
MYTLHARPGWGSAIVEAQLAWYGLPFSLVEVGQLFESGEARERLSAVNPIHQIPTLILPDGAVMTESAAITLHLADVTKSSELVPEPNAPERARFLRWLVFLVANVYPTFTYADDPARFVSVEAARAPFKDSVNAYRKRLWTMLEVEASPPWFLGGRFSALDIYVAVMTNWTPKRKWFIAECPKLAAIAAKAEAEPRLAQVWQRNQLKPGG